KTLNAIVDDGKADIQAFITQAKTDLTKVKDDATEEITTIANNSKSSVQDTASTSINAINATTTEATEHVDTKVTEFNQTVADNGFLSPQILDGKLKALNWQKYKLTEGDGTTSLISDFDFNIPEEALKYSAGTYYIRGALNSTSNNIISNYGYLTISTTYSTKSVADLTFVPLGSNTLNDISIYKCKKNGDWGNWNKVTQTQTDTGWVPFNL